MKEPSKPPRSMARREIENLGASIVVALCVVPVVYSLTALVNTYFSFVLSMKNALAVLNDWWLVVPFALGGLAVGLIVQYLAPEAEGPGLHIVIAAFDKLDGKLRRRTGLFKYITTLITIGSGTPNGIVSPSAMLGNSIASYLGDVIFLDADRQKTLSLCGMSAAISTLLGAPFGAALFAVEVVYGNYILYKRFFYCLASSITAYIFTMLLGIQRVHPTIILETVFTLRILSMIVVCALIAVAVNIGYIHLYQKIHDFTFSLSWGNNSWLNPVVGMTLAGVIIAPAYHVLYELGIVGGHYSITAGSQTPLQIILVIGIIIVTTSLIAGTGGSGGLFMPVLAVGVLLGQCVGSYAAAAPALLFVAAGISAALCTTLNVPLASALLCIELFGPLAVVPSITGSLCGYFLAKKYIIYHEIQWEELKEQ